jgi:arsenate reductase
LNLHTGARAMTSKQSVTLWHNPRCSKSRGALELLRERGVEPTIVDYQKNPPTVAEIEHALKLLGRAPRELMRKGEAVYAELGLDDPGLTRQQLIQAMAEHPILIERPVAFANGKAAIGRPPEDVLAIL